MHQEYFASKTSYPFESTIYTPVPNGYLPVFINYIGRHGSRHLTGPKYDVTLKKLLDIATESKQITKTGLTLRSEIEALIQIENGHYGKLSELGKKGITKHRNKNV